MIIQLFQFIFIFARSDLMEQNTNLLFENKIGCVANLLQFNDGEREILKTASWISLNNMMLSQTKNYTEDEKKKKGGEGGIRFAHPLPSTLALWSNLFQNFLHRHLSFWGPTPRKLVNLVTLTTFIFGL